MAHIKLSTAAMKAKAAYQRQWQARNRDKQREYVRIYWERKGAELMAMGTVPVNDTINDTLMNSVPNYTASCEECGIKFVPQRKTARFCGTVCRVRFNRKFNSSIK